MPASDSINTNITSLYEYRINEWENDLSAVQKQWDDDAVLLETYKDQKDISLNLGLVIKDQILKVVTELENSRDKLWSDLADFAGTLYDRAMNDDIVEDIFNQIFDPFLEAVNSLTEVISLAPLP